jgi:hypothetical protein
MKIRSFKQFINEMNAEELESQTVPTHICIKDLIADGFTLIKKNDLVFLDKEELECIIIDGSMEGSIVSLLNEKDVEIYLEELTPENKHKHRGLLIGKKFGL